MNKSVIAALTLGLVLGVGSLTIKSFANDKQANTQLFTNQSSSQSDSQFKVLNQETNQFETLDDSNYRNSNSGFGQCCNNIN